MKLTECDTCQKTTPEGHEFGWLIVGVMEESGFMSRDETDKTFCSWDCVAKFAEKRRGA